MKSPAFQWYAADYLADERVMQLSLESEAAYVRLLNYCWREGSIPANATQCAPMCKYADVKVIKPALALFMKSPTQSGRLIHKRLEEERAKQEAFRAKQAAHGKKGGRPRKDDEKPEKPNPLPSLSQPLAEPNLSLSPRMPSSLSSSLSSMSSNDDNASEPSPLSAELQERLAGIPNTDDEVRWDESILTKPDYFAKIAGKLVETLTDVEHYRKAALIVAEADNTHRNVKGWESWVVKFFTNQKSGAQKTGGGLLKINASLQPKGKAVDEPDYRLNQTAVARRRREQEEREERMMAENVARVAANDAKRQAAGQFAGTLPA